MTEVGGWVRGRSLTGGELAYQLRGALGQGGMATVYRAYDPQLGREVALKVLEGELTPNRLARFEREGQAVASLSHPHVIGIHDAGVVEGRPCLAYELVEGAKPLDDAWRTLDLEARLDLLAAVIDGVAHAHARGVVHRDIKPENALVDAQGRARVTDFGLAAIAEGSQRLTQTGAMLGTPQTMAPEQVAGERDRQGPATDVWALGVLLYLALTDRWPFEGQGLTEILARIARGNPDAPRAVRADVDRAVEAVCLQALKPEPEARYPDAGALGQALTAARAGRGPRTGRPWAKLVAGALVLVAAVALGRATAPTPEPAAPSPSPSASSASPTAPAGPTPTPTASPTATAPSTVPLEAAGELGWAGERRLLALTSTPTDLWGGVKGRRGMLMRFRRDEAGAPRRGVGVALAKGTRWGTLATDPDGVAYVVTDVKDRVGLRLIRLGDTFETVWEDPAPRSKHVRCVFWRRQGTLRAAIAADGQVWIVTLGAKPTSARVPWPRGDVAGVCYLPPPTHLLVVAGKANVLPGLGWYDPETGVRRDFVNVLSPPKSPAPTPTGHLIVGAASGHITRYRMQEFTFLPPGVSNLMAPIHRAEVQQLVRTHDDGMVSRAGSNKEPAEVLVWNLRTLAVTQRITLPEPIFTMVWDQPQNGVWLAQEKRLLLYRRP